MHQQADPLDARPLDLQADTQTMRVTITVTEDQAEMLASGYVPRGVKAQLRELLDYAEIDETRAARPLRKKRKNAE